MKRAHAFYVFLVILALGLSVILAQAAPKGSGNETGCLEITYDFPAPEVIESGEYDTIRMKGLNRFGKPGLPVLPYKTARVLIPFNTEVTRIEVDPGKKVTLAGSHVIEPGQQPVPIGYDGPAEFTQPAEAVYRSSRPFPEKRYGDSSTGCKQGYKFAMMNLHPVEYLPLDGIISYYPQMTVRVYTSTVSGKVPPRGYTPFNAASSAKERGYLPPRGHLLPNEAKIIEGLVDNPGMMRRYLPMEEPASGGSAAGEPLSTTSGEGVSTLLAPGNYEYVIITKQGLVDSTKEFTFQDLIDHKTARGTPTTLVTREWIYDNYDGTRPDGGSDKQTKIRNFIIDAYNTWGTKYVLLGGDGDGANVGGESGNNVIPARGFTGMGIQGETNIPSDMYYSCLDGSFDFDADGIYGESTDGPGGGEVDLFAEVYVGRAPVDSDAEVSNFVKKTIAYENTFVEDPSLKKALILGEDLGWTYWGCDYKEEVRDGSCNHGYCTTGFPPGWDITNLCDRDNVWDETDLLPLLNNGIHLVNHLGHANVGYNMKIYNDDVDGLVNDQYFFAYSQGCYSGSFDNRTTSAGSYTDYDCIAEHLVTKGNGAFAVVMNSRYGWGMQNSTDGPSQHFDREFFDAYFGEGIVNLGIINQDSKEDCAGYISADPYGRWCAYQTNLLGDPQTPLGGSVGPTGGITLDQGAYPPGSNITIMVNDSDLNTDPAVIEQYSDRITVTTEGGDQETNITLIETAPDSGIFSAVIATEDASAVAGDGVLQILCFQANDGITVTYYDASDGNGNPATPSFTAYGDCVAPDISSIEATDIGYFGATITWDTDEPADSHVLYGTSPPPTSSVSSQSLTAAHAISLTGLSPDTTYYFQVASADEAGNQTVDNNSNNYYTFTTLPCVVDPTVVSPSEAFGLVRNNQTVITAQVGICEAPEPDATVTVDFDSGEPSLTLLDDGVAPDGVANDGSYSAYWVPQVSGDLTLTFTASVQGYDDATEQVSGTVAHLAADFSADHTYGAPPFMVQFSDLSEGDLGIDTWLWDFGDGETSTEQNSVHIYYSEANYNVSLTVTYKTVNVTETKVRYIEVLNDPPPTIYAITPNQGDNDSFTPVSIEGYCFLETPHVSIYGGGSYSVGACYCSPTDVFVSGDYAYVPDNNIYYPKLQVLDISDPSNPTIVGSCDTPYGKYNDVFVSGDYAYLAGSDAWSINMGLQVMDVTDPANPTVVGLCGTPHPAQDVYVAGSYAYLADSDSGLLVIDVSNPANPFIAGSCDTPVSANSVYVSANHAYVCDHVYGSGGDSKLQVIDISNPADPVIAGSCDTPEGANSVHVSGNYAYVADYGPIQPYDPSLDVIDISNPASPVIVGVCDLPGAAMNVFVSGSYAYVADYASGLGVVDITDPTNPVIAASFHTPSAAGTVHVSGDYAYVAEGYNLEVINVSSLSNPSVVGWYDTPGTDADIFVSDNHAYVVDSDGSLEVIDVTNPKNPVMEGACEIPGEAWGVYAAGGYVYVTDYGTGASGLQIIDVSEPDTPLTITGSFPTNWARDVYVSGDYAYVGGDNYFKVIDVTDPANPVLVGSCDTPSNATGVHVSGNIACVSNYLEGLQVIDVSDPASPIIVGACDTDGYAYDVYVSGGYAYVADFGKLHVVDISDPANPSITGQVAGSGGAYFQKVHVSDGYVYVAPKSSGSGLRVVDVSNPSTPAIVAGCDAGGAVFVSGDYVYLAGTVNSFKGGSRLEVVNKFVPCTDVTWLNDGEITATIPAGFSLGTYDLHVTNPYGGHAVMPNAFTVTGTPNAPPVVSDIPDQTIPEGSSFATINLDEYVADPDNTDGEIVWSYSGDTELSVSIMDRVATVAVPSGDWNGSETITFTATDPGFLFDSDSASFTVTAVNDAPVVADIPAQTIAEGESFATINLDDYVSDVDNTDAEMAWSYSGNAALVVSIADRIATVSVPNGDWNGSETITFTAEDPGLLSDSDSASFTVTAVNDAPVVADIPAQTIAEGESFATINLDDYVSDADNTAIDISWSYSGNTDLTVSITDRVATVCVPSGDWNGSETITFTATDPGSLFDSDDAIFTVTPLPNVPPVADAGDNRVVYNEIVLDASGSYDSDGTIVSYEWDIQHRDTPAYNRTATGVNPVISDLEHGFYFVTLTITDNEGATATDEMLLGANHNCGP